MTNTVEQIASTHNHRQRVAGPSWFLNRQRIGWLNRQRDPFNTAAWLEAINDSHLADCDKDTARHIAAHTGWYGTTNITRDALALLAGVTRVATITARVGRLRDAGYIATRTRYNAPLLTALTFPTDTHAPTFEDPGYTLPGTGNLHDSPVSF